MSQRKLPILEMHPLEVQAYLSGLLKIHKCDSQLPTFLAYFWQDEELTTEVRQTIQASCKRLVPEGLQHLIGSWCIENKCLLTRDCLWGFTLKIDRSSRVVTNGCRKLASDVFKVATKYLDAGGVTATLGVHPYASFCQLCTTNDWDFSKDLNSLKKPVDVPAESIVPKLILTNG